MKSTTFMIAISLGSLLVCRCQGENHSQPPPPKGLTKWGAGYSTGGSKNLYC